MKTFNNVINSIICCAMEARTSIVLNIEIVQFVLQNYEKLLSEVCMIKKASHSNIYNCTLYI